MHHTHQATQPGQVRMPQGGVAVQPIGMPMPPLGMLQAGMPQQQNMPAFNGIMQPTNMMTGPPTQIMGLPPMGGLSPNMPFPGMMSEQQAMQMTRGIMLPGGMMVGMSPGTMMAGALTQQMGMLPPIPGPMGMQQANMAAQSTGMGMPPAGIGQPAQGQQQTIDRA